MADHRLANFVHEVFWRDLQASAYFNSFVLFPSQPCELLMHFTDFHSLPLPVLAILLHLQTGLKFTVPLPQPPTHGLVSLHHQASLILKCSMMSKCELGFSEVFL